MSRVIVAGPRDLDVDVQTVQEAIFVSGFDVTEVVHGGATGVDAAAACFAEAYMIPVRVFRPKWGTHGRAAGPIRNRNMAEYADALVAIRQAGRMTAGTNSMIREAKNVGIPVYVREVAS